MSGHGGGSVLHRGLVDSTNWAGANWIPYTASPVVNVGATQGWHQIWFGLRGLPPSGQQTWNWVRVNVQTNPPLLVITNPVPGTVQQPMIEVQGYCAEPLASLSLRRDQRGWVAHQPAGHGPEPAF